MPIKGMRSHNLPISPIGGVRGPIFDYFQQFIELSTVFAFKRRPALGKALLRRRLRPAAPAALAARPYSNRAWTAQLFSIHWNSSLNGKLAGWSLNLLCSRY